MSFINTLTQAGNGSCQARESAQVRRPFYEITETDTAFSLEVSLPGVSKEGLEITDEGGALTITGKRTSRLPEGLEVLHRESTDASFELVLTHDNTIEAEKAEAELRDGVLRLKIAKAESAKPRKITVS
jgi:HSP20 family protein